MRLGQILLFAAAGALAVWLILRALSWLVRRPWIYAASIRELESRPVPSGALLFVGSSTAFPPQPNGIHPRQRG